MKRSNSIKGLPEKTRLPKLLLAAGAIFTAFALWACASGASDQGAPAPAPASGDSASELTESGDDQGSIALSYGFSRFAKATNSAVGLAFDTRGRLLYAEKDNGRILRFANGVKRTLARLGVVGGGESGLLGLTVDRTNNVYAYYTSSSSRCPDPTKTAGGGSIQGHCVWRFRPAGRDGRLVADGMVFSADHPSSADNHVGGGLHIGPDDALYLSIGDLGENDDPEAGPGRAQDLDGPFGKILRLDPSGSNRGGSGNPATCGNAGNSAQRKIEDGRIWACGLRNTYQFTFDANGRMWGSEAGDSCDEINLISAGVNFGWQPPRTDCAGSGAGEPRLKLQGKTPSGIAVPTSRSAGSWRNDVFYCAFTDGGKLMRYDQNSQRPREVTKARGRCLYDVIARGNRLYISSGDVIYRLTIRR